MEINIEPTIIEKYLNNEKVSDIVKSLGIHTTIVYTTLKNNNIKLRSKRQYNINELIDDYIKCNSLSALSRKYKMSATTIKKLLLDNNIDTTKNFRLYEIDEDYFNLIDSKDKAYFLGLLYADGYVNKEGFFLSLCETDLPILETFKKYLKYSGNIKTKNTKNSKHCTQKQLNIYSSKMAEKLTQLGCFQNKSLTITFPTFLTEEMIPHFIRGYFDGDGSIYMITSISACFSIIGNEDLVSAILKKIVNATNLPEKVISKDKRCKKTASFKYSNRNHLLKIYKYLYAECEDLYMERKFTKFTNFLYEKKLL